MIPIIFGSLDFQLGNLNRWKVFREQKYAYIYHLSTKIWSTIICMFKWFWTIFSLGAPDMYFDSYMCSSLFNLRVVTFFLNFLLPMQHLPILITLSFSWFVYKFLHSFLFKVKYVYNCNLHHDDCLLTNWLVCMSVGAVENSKFDLIFSQVQKTRLCYHNTFKCYTCSNSSESD